MIESPHYTPEHEIFREGVRRFVTRECVPHREAWQKDCKVPRDVWTRAGELGLLCPKLGAEWGGGGGDAYHGLVIIEEQTRAGFSELAFYLHSDIIVPYIELYGTDDQKARYLSRMATGELVSAIAMTEPGAGSDLQAIRTRAVRDGDHYLLSGQKTFISNAQVADLIVVAAKTDPDAGSRGVSLLILETADAEGFTLGRNLKKVGCKAQDTSELFFDNVRVPVANLLGGEEGRGFYQLMQRLPEERLIMAMSAVAQMECGVDEAVAYAKTRKVFGQRLIDHQDARFKLAECRTTATLGRAYLERCIDLFIEGRFDARDGAMAKWWTTEKACEVLDDCLQIFGGYGYMKEYPIARRWADARLGRIAGGTNEIMKDLIGRSL
ncbi:acyl-CoA dehydrogenase family protein [Phenylobacterium sp.]|uniref:acyl-CoA dehydrogenase family protein n=1 Tax=Phenylobacterium sp. TaxID=1871053 RepID=UPI0025DFF7C1|nr:acyl-CoA dehydrogenase family protein [Phenylobacterium sp.]MBX3483401.1 acyl-CoA dehydrogenase family protein [Phenylobacterium sp.]MCW5758546.1 acyl-CoA dehydrogenase family protein [Phenylobacterium sp.]